MKRKKSKKKGFNLFLVVTLFLIFFLFKSSNSTTLENLPIQSWVYPVIDQLYVQGFFQKLHKNLKPYKRGEIARYLLDINKKIKRKVLFLSPYQKWLIKKLNLEFKEEIEALAERKQRIKYGINPFFYLTYNRIDTSWARGKLILEGAFQFKDRLVLKDKILICTKAEKEKNIFGKEWENGLTGVFDESYIELDLGHLFIFFGRDYFRWGPGANDFLLLSGFSPPFDMLKLQSSFGSFKFLFFATLLDEVTYSDKLYKRYLSGHRIDFKPFSWLELGLSEVVVYGGERRGLEPYYLNPILFYYGEQWNQGYDDNPLWNFDFSFTKFKNTEIYGEILIDDFQYDFKTEPQQIGFRLGLSKANLLNFDGTFLNLEYERINNWVYGQNKLWNLYTYHNVGMGSFLGPDADRFYLEFFYHLSYEFLFGLKGEYRRKGEGRIDVHPKGPVPKTKFPSGIVEHTKKISLKSIYQPNPYLLVEGEAGFNRIDNNEFEKKDQDNFFFSIRFNYNFWKESKF